MGYNLMPQSTNIMQVCDLKKPIKCWISIMVGNSKVPIMTRKGNVLTLCFSMYCPGLLKKKEIREHGTTYNMCLLRIDLNCLVIEITMCVVFRPSIVVKACLLAISNQCC